MTRLRFTKPWGPYKPGDVIEVQEQRTVEWHVYTCRRAVIDNPERPHIPIIDAVYLPGAKYLRKAKRDKMMQRPGEAKHTDTVLDVQDGVIDANDILGRIDKFAAKKMKEKRNG